MASFDALDRQELDDVKARVKGKRTSNVERFKQYANDPIAFANDVLGYNPTEPQARVLSALVDHDRVAVPAGQKVGKSDLAAVAKLWFASTRVDGRAFYTNSGQRQVELVNYRALKKLYRRARANLGGIIYDTPGRGIQWDDDRQIIGFTTDEVDRWGGISGRHLFFVVDEASGVPPDIFEAILGNAAGGNCKILLLGNPLRSEGYFFEACRGTQYKVIHIPSSDSPNVKAGKIVVPGLATQQWIDEMTEAYGEGSVFVSARIRGEFPSAADGQIISLALVQQAKERYRREDFHDAGPLELGVDVARFGDDESVIYARRGNVVLPAFVYRKLDTVTLAGRVVDIVSELRKPGEVPIVRVDVIGIGAGVVDTLRRAGNMSVVAINVGESASDQRYQRKRDEVWFGLKNWLQNGGAIPADPKLEGELTSPTYHFTPAQKIQVESKDELKKRLKRSPDRADALALCVYASHRPPHCEARWSTPMALAEGDHVEDRRPVNLIGWC